MMVFRLDAGRNGFVTVIKIIICIHVGVVGLRTRNKCTFVLYDVDDEANIVIHNCVAVDRNDDFPFVSLDVVANQFCTVDANHEVNFWNPMKQM